MPLPLVKIVVLNWNGWQDTIECLESLFRIAYPNYHVIVVDNGSTDDSVSKIRKWMDGKVKGESRQLTIIETKENLGFARGNNVGIRHALASKDTEYILILNNDTVVKPDFLSPMIKVFEDFPKVGLVGPKIVDYYSGKHWQGVLLKRFDLLTYIMFYTPLKWFFIRTFISKKYLVEGTKPKKIYGIGGCCMLFKKEALEKIGLFDEITFLGWEEYIVAEKLLGQGFDTYVTPESSIYHKVGRGTLKMDAVEKDINFLKSENYFLKNYLKIPIPYHLIIKSIRLLTYSVLALVIRSYRNNYKCLLNAVFEKM